MPRPKNPDRKPTATGARNNADGSRELEIRAVQMRIARATFEQIGQALGVDTSAAKSMVDRAMKQRIAEQAHDRDRLIGEQRELISAMIRARFTDAVASRPSIRRADYPDGESFTAALEAANAVSGIAVRATDSVVRLLAREAKLLGLDAPVRHEHDVRVTDAMAAEIEKLAQEIIDMDAAAAQMDANRARG